MTLANGICSMMNAPPLPIICADQNPCIIFQYNYTPFSTKKQQTNCKEKMKENPQKRLAIRTEFC